MRIHQHLLSGLLSAFALVSTVYPQSPTQSTRASRPTTNQQRQNVADQAAENRANTRDANNAAPDLQPGDANGITRNNSTAQTAGDAFANEPSRNDPPNGAVGVQNYPSRLPSDNASSNQTQSDTSNAGTSTDSQFNGNDKSQEQRGYPIENGRKGSNSNNQRNNSSQLNNGNLSRQQRQRQFNQNNVANSNTSARQANNSAPDLQPGDANGITRNNATAQVGGNAFANPPSNSLPPNGAVGVQNFPTNGQGNSNGQNNVNNNQGSNAMNVQGNFDGQANVSGQGNVQGNYNGQANVNGPGNIQGNFNRQGNFSGQGNFNGRQSGRAQGNSRPQSNAGHGSGQRHGGGGNGSSGHGQAGGGDSSFNQGGFGGVYGGSGAVNTDPFGLKAAGDYMHGEADVIRSNGDLNLSNAAATSMNVDTSSKVMDNSLKHARTYFERKAIHDRYMYAKGTPKTDSSSSSWDRMNRERAANKRMDRKEFDTTFGIVYWPGVLKGKAFSRLRAEVENLMADRSSQASGLGSENCRDVRRLADQMHEVLQGQVDDMPSDEYMVAFKFIKGLKIEARLGADPRQVAGD